MKGGKNLSTIVDYFLILSAIIGVGFASGKEIYEFFFAFDGASIIGVLTFGLLYIYLFFVVDYVKIKLQLNSYNQFNAAIFGKLTKITNIFIVINFVITSAGMLAGADYLFETFFGVSYKIPSIIICLISFFIMLGGINKIKGAANLIIPIMIACIVINAFANITPQNVNMEINLSSSMLAIFYGLLFGVNNFVAALPVLFETKQKRTDRILVIITICLIILLNILVLASNNTLTDMPMFETSANISIWFYYIYFASLILALFSTFLICSYNTYKIVCNGKKSIFVIILVILTSMIISNLGYNLIVKYLYVISGMISAIYVLVLIIMITIKLISLKRNRHKQNLQNINND